MHYGQRIQIAEWNCKENRDKGSHTGTLWTTFFYTQDEKKKNFSDRFIRKPGFLDVDVHIYMGSGY